MALVTLTIQDTDDGNIALKAQFEPQFDAENPSGAQVLGAQIVDLVVAAGSAQDGLLGLKIDGEDVITSDEVGGPDPSTFL
jgi:hypothetical protein